MKKTILLLLIFTIVLVCLTTFFWLYEVQFKIGRATVISSFFSVSNSYIFVTPLRAKANNQEKIRINIFVLDNQGIGLGSRKAQLSSSDNLKAEAVQGLTDAYGKAIFDVSSSKAGEYYLDVTIDGVNLNQKAHLSFY